MTKPKIPEILSTLESYPYDDFRNFLYDAWAFLGLGVQPTELQYAICEDLQSGELRLIIEAGRGEGKSWITACFVCWSLLRDPHMKILVVSASGKRAKNFTTFTLNLIKTMPCLQHLTPNPGAGDRESTIAFDVAGLGHPDQAPSVSSCGILGNITGSRADLIVADDVENPENSDTQGKRDKIAEAVKELALVIKKGGRIIYLGTPQTEQSLYNLLREERGYVARIYPARYPNAEKIEGYGDALAPFIRRKILEDPSLCDPRWGISGNMGTPTDPSFWGEDELLLKELEVGRSTFMLQFMLDTSLSDSERYPLKLRDLIVMDLPSTEAPESIVWCSAPEREFKTDYNVGFSGDRFYRPMKVAENWLPYQGIVLAIDPAGRGRDETGWAIVAMLHGNLFLLDFGGFSEGYDDSVLQALANLAEQFKITDCFIEKNMGDGMFTKLLTPYLTSQWPCNIEEIHVTGNKEARLIDNLEPVMNQHRLVVNARLIEEDYTSTLNRPVDKQNAYRGFFQLTRLMREKGALLQDDRLEAISMGVKFWMDVMDQDQDRRSADAKEDRIEAALRLWAESTGVLGKDEALHDVWTQTT